MASVKLHRWMVSDEQSLDDITNRFSSLAGPINDRPEQARIRCHHSHDRLASKQCQVNHDNKGRNQALWAAIPGFYISQLLGIAALGAALCLQISYYKATNKRNRFRIEWDRYREDEAVSSPMVVNVEFSTKLKIFIRIYSVRIFLFKPSKRQLRISGMLSAKLYEQ
ncbi:hypothetical protein K440DRAFT_638166 [Wilcoxina mikolae CBS 423.85]|nr:hypothetical protein K440DRAFT_638166 [Wilcoxina mikolae CBS 423.85]